MSAVAAVLARDGGDAAKCRHVHRMLESMAGRGSDRQEAREVSGGALGAGRYDWEMGTGFAGPVTVVREGDVVIAADATLYYLDDLRRSFGAEGVTIGGPTPSHHLLAAYRAWGAACASRIEGDFAFVLWDEGRERAVAARDFAGLRPLHYAVADGTLVVASTVAGVASHPRCGGELNFVSIAETAADLWAHTPETCYEGVFELPAGHSLTWSAGSPPEITPHWRPPAVAPEDGASPEEAAGELRRRLRKSTEARLAGTGRGTVWMSGGIDSTAVFAAGQHALERGTAEFDALMPVTVRYPPEDPGHEDDYVSAVAGRWNQGVHWLDIGDIPMYDRPAERAADRDVPYAHCYETWIRALARGSREVGSRVALGGYGGDQLFQVSDVFLSDLFYSGRWMELAREWKAKDGGSLGDFYRWVVRPRLPRRVRTWIARVRPRWRAAGYLERSVPPWIDADFAADHRLRERERDGMPDRPNGVCASDEMHFYLSSSYYPRVSSTLTGLALEEGVEVRTPLYDRRLVDLAARRPRRERNTGTERKVLLRAAMEGLLPDSVLRSRSGSTGLMSGYFERSTRVASAELLERAFEEPALERVGIVDGEALRSAWRRYRSRGGETLGAALVQSFHAELWLKARLSKREDEHEDSGQGVRREPGEQAATGAATLRAGSPQLS